MLALCSRMWVYECEESGGVLRGRVEMLMVWILVFWLREDVFVVEGWWIIGENQLCLLWFYWTLFEVWWLAPLEVCERWQIWAPLEVW